jgi:hypothetical protein
MCLITIINLEIYFYFSNQIIKLANKYNNYYLIIYNKIYYELYIKIIKFQILISILYYIKLFIFYYFYIIYIK